MTSATSDFAIPDKPATLLTEQAGGWRVRKTVDASVHELAALAKRVSGNGLALGEPGAFDLVFSALHAFPRLEPAVQAATAMLLVGATTRDRSDCDLSSGAVQAALKACKRVVQSGASDQEGAHNRAVLKAAVYLLSWLVVEAEKAHADKAVAAAAKKNAATAKAPKKGKAGAEEAEVFDWDVYREQAALRLQEVLDALEPEATPRLSQLWNHRPPDEPFVLRFSLAGYAILEQPAVLKAGVASLRDALWRLIALPAVRHDQAEATISRLVPLVLESAHETTTTYIAELMQYLLNEHSAAPLVAKMLAELASLPASQMADDKAGPKNVASFVHAFAGRAPLMLFLNMELLQPHVEAVSHHLRCGAVRTYGQLLVQLAKLQTSSPAEASEILAEIVPADIVRVLLERTKDIHSLVRAAALETLCQLCESEALSALCRSQALALAVFQETAEMGLHRLADKAANVRRKALQLFCKLLDYNPFGLKTLRLAKLEATREELRERTVSDVEEAMKAVVYAHCIELEGARPSSVLTLVFSKEPKVKEAALQAAQSVYLEFTGARRGTAEQVQVTSRRLLDLVGEASLAELTSLEECVAEWQRQALLPTTLIATLWDIVQGRSSPKDRSAALALLNMASASDPQLLCCKRDLLIEQAKSQAQALEKGMVKLDLTFGRHVCIALQRCSFTPKDLKEAKEAKAIADTMAKFLVHEPPPPQAGAWFAVAEQAIASLFAYGQAPEQLCTSFLRKMGEGVYGEAICPAALSRLLFCLGHVAVKTLVHVEQCEKMLLSQQAQAAAPPAPAAQAAAPAKGGRGKKSKAAVAEAEEQAPESESIAEELGTSADEIEQEKEYLEKLGSGLLEPTAMLGSWAPLVAAVCRDADKQFGAELRSSAVLALCKFMCVSAKFCEAHLQLLFSVMECEPEVAIRANIAIALGDLAGLHQNVLEPWTPRLYSQLAKSVQPDARVRKNVLMVLTQLILSGKILMKGQLSEEEGSAKSGAAELALRLIDEDARIASLARLFFSEFSKKAATNISNLLPDVVSALARDATLAPPAFREVISFLVDKVPKGKPTEAMVDGLCRRFSLCDAPLYLRCIAFCVCELNHSDKSVRKLYEQRKEYSNKLGDDEVLSCFTNLVARMRKSTALQPELKPALDELEDFLKKASKTRGAGDDAAADDDENMAPAAESEATRPAPTPAAAKAAKGKKATKAASQRNVDTEENEAPLNPRASRRSARA